MIQSSHQSRYGEIRVRFVAETESRPNVLYVSGPGGDDFKLRLQHGKPWNENDPIGIGGAYYPPQLEPGELRDASFVPDKKQMRRLSALGLPSNLIIADDPATTDDREERLWAGSWLRHEFKHYEGLGEFEAYRASFDYLSKHGIDEVWPDEAVFSYLCSCPYSAAELALASAEYERRMRENKPPHQICAPVD